MAKEDSEKIENLTLSLAFIANGLNGLCSR